jgi:hypothetical protein
MTPPKVNDVPKNSLDEVDDAKKKRNNNVNAIDEILNPGRIMPMSEGYMGGRSTIGNEPKTTLGLSMVVFLTI